jgi:hypothetical protein
MSDETGGEEMASEPDWHIDGLPDALVKACSDPFDYAMGLRTGPVIRFESATLSTDHQWIHVAVQHHGYDADAPDVMTGCPFTFECGVDVRVSDIMWVADAPNGS